MLRPAGAVLLASVLAACAAPATSSDTAETAGLPAGPEVPPQVVAVLDEIRRLDTGHLAVSEEDGRFLRLMVASSGAQHALEIGAASGYSAIWIGLGLRETGGRLVTIEYDAQRAQEATANVRRAGLDDVVHVVAGDAFEEIPKVAGPIDFVFLDAWKPDYQRFFEIVMPRLAPGGLFLAHNVINKRSQMTDFLETIQSHPQLLTTIVAPSEEGVSVSWKRK